MEWLKGLSVAPPFARSVALLVGVGSYSNPPLSERRLPSRQDVAAMRDFLLLDEKFDIVYVLLDQEAAPSKIDNLMMGGLEATDKIHRGDRFLFYFSGHGTDVGSGVGYMLFSNYRGKYDRESTLPVNQCEQWGLKLPAKHVLFLLDGCSSGLGIVPKSPDALSRRAGDGSRVAYTATRGNEAAIARVGMSVFTRAFLEVVRNGLADRSRGGFMTIHGIADEVENRLANQLSVVLPYHDKEPADLPLPGWIRNRGEFVFVNPKVNQGLDVQAAIEGGRSGLVDLKSESSLPDSPTMRGALPAQGAALPESHETLAPSAANSALTIMSDQMLALASVGIPYFLPLRASGGIPPYSWEANGLPEGLMLQRSPGMIVGTPTRRQSVSTSLTVTDGAGISARKSVQIRVVGSPSIRTSILRNGVSSVRYSVGLEANDGIAPYHWTMTRGGLPPGLALDSAKGLIEGTPSKPGDFGFTIKLQDREGRESSRTYLIAVKPNFSISTQSLLKAIIGVSYRQPVIAAGGTPPYKWSIKAGSLPDGLALAPGTSEITGKPSRTGVFSILLQADDSSGRTAVETFSVDVVGPVHNTTGNSPLGVIGKPYMFVLTANGGSPPLVWGDPQGLPSGLSLSASGVINGTPEVTGSFPCSAVVTDTGVDQDSDAGIYGTECCGGRMQPVNFSIFVDEALYIATPSFAGGVTGQQYDARLVDKGGGSPTGRKWSIASGALPDGLNLVEVRPGIERDDFRIRGVPTRRGRFDFVVEVDNGDGETDAKPLSIFIVDPLEITASSLASGLVGKPYSETLTASGGVVPYVWAIQPALPPGLILDRTTGAVRGVPRTDGSFSITVWLSDSAGHTASKMMSLGVAAH
jgi:hypothetical protein